MKFKMCFIILIMAIFLFGIASVCASDANDTAVASEDIDQTKEDIISLDKDTNLASSEKNEILAEGEQTFRKLNEKINGKNDKNIYLNSNYKYSKGDDNFISGIVIDRDVNIYGNGHTIDGNNTARIFQINSGNVIFYNITFKNGIAGFLEDGGAINGGCEAINCIFTNNHAYNGGAMEGGSAVNCTFNNNIANNGGAMERGSAVNCTFNNNAVIEWGGAMCSGFAVNCIFNNNNAGEGGAMYKGSAVNCTFNNNAANNGGAMSSGSAVNCTFNNNNDQEGCAMVSCYIKNCNGDSNKSCDVLEPSFFMSNLISTYGSNQELSILLINQNWQYVKFIDVECIIYNNGTEILRKHGISGFNINFDLAAGIYTAQLNVIYPGLTANSKNITLTINKATPNIEMHADDTTYPGNVVVYVKSDVGGVYVVNVGGVSQNVNLAANEVKNITFAGLPANENGYIVNVTNLDHENCTDSVNDSEVVKIRKANVKINSQDITATYNIDGLMIVRLTDINGNPIGGASISVDLNGPKTYTTNSNGEINISTAGLTPKTYTAKITFKGNNNCTESSADYKVIIKKATPKITAKKKTYKVKSKTKKFKITLKDNTGKPIKNAKVRLIIKKIAKKSKSDKKKNYAKTNKKGKATFKVLKNKKGKYKAKIMFYGNQYYNKTTKTVKITIK